ncbi:hypothetical protein K438DRAFT_860206 [Mycena galopus ATCC 62051]|nr:hypothetical protein K438DRAFT_860206 [Mycena galopus ATCC 62051]
MGPLVTWKPADTEDEGGLEWNEELAVDNNHWIPAIGHAPDALRILFVISPLTKKTRVLTKADKERAAITKYLLERHDKDPLVQEIREVMGSKHRGRGRTPKSWKRWVLKIRDVYNAERRVRVVIGTRTESRLVKYTHVAGILHVGADWVSQCVQAADIIDAPSNQNIPALKAYLRRDDDDEDLTGIAGFLSSITSKTVLKKKAAAKSKI